MEKVADGEKNYAWIKREVEIEKEVAKEKKKTKSQKEEIIRRRKSIFPADFFELAHLGREREAIYYLTEKGIKLRGSERERERERELLSTTLFLVTPHQ